MAHASFEVTEDRVPGLMAHHFNVMVGLWLATDLPVEEIVEGAAKLLDKSSALAFSDMISALQEQDDQLSNLYGTGSDGEW